MFFVNIFFSTLKDHKIFLKGEITTNEWLTMLICCWNKIKYTKHANFISIYSRSKYNILIWHKLLYKDFDCIFIKNHIGISQNWIKLTYAKHSLEEEEKFMCIIYYCNIYYIELYVVLYIIFILSTPYFQCTSSFREPQ